jgi:hypothetical protein
LLIPPRRWGANPAENAEKLLRAELRDLSAAELKVRAKDLMGHDWDEPDDDDLVPNR